MAATLQFLGAAETVTGSRYLLTTDGHRYLVDCGLFQGGRTLDDLNWHTFPVAPAEIDAVLITHAHIDHTGYLPRLVLQGFRGPVYATEATCALLELLLPDSAYLQEQEAAYANKKGYSRHKPALPLYTTADAQDALRLLQPVPFHAPQHLNGLRVTWRPAGHILGSACLEAQVSLGNEVRSVVFSGDLGRYDEEVMAAPWTIPNADYLLVESTYGGRLHSDQPIEESLAAVINGVVERGGVVLIPAFAVGRTQQILYYIRKVQDEKRAPDIPVYIDSPMAVEASHIYCQFGDDHNLDVNLLMDEHQCPLRCRHTHFVTDVEDSKQLNTMPGPAIILSASGMCTGGRILHHLKWRLPDARNTVLFVGYQAEGTRGRALLDGAETLRIHGETVPVRSQIASIDGLSAHGDQNDLLRWLSGFHESPRHTFIVHGETPASAALQKSIQEQLGWRRVTIAGLGDEAEID